MDFNDDDFFIYEMMQEDLKKESKPVKKSSPKHVDKKPKPATTPPQKLCTKSDVRSALISICFSTLLICLLSAYTLPTLIDEYRARGFQKEFMYVGIWYLILGLWLILSFVRMFSVQGYLNEAAASGSESSEQSGGNGGNDHLTPKQLLLIFVVVFILVGCITGIVIHKHYTETDPYKYAKAEEMIAHEHYAEARRILWDVSPDYQDAASLSSYLCARLFYDYEDYTEAYQEMQDAEFHYQTDEQLEKIKEFEASLNEKYEEYEAYQEMDEENLKEEEERKAKEKSAASDDEDEEETSSTKKKRRSKAYYPDPSEYPDAEEFYYYHRDDFLDFEDAENYYNENK